MTAESHEPLLPRSTLATLPRVNLLPPEMGEQRRFRQIQLGLGAAVLAAFVVVGLLVLSAHHGVSQAQSRLDDTRTVATDLNAQRAKYSDVTAVYARAAAAQTMLSRAMGNEVRFSQLLNDLSLSVPENVWISSLNLSAVPVSGTAPVGSTANLIGSQTVSGVAFSHDDVAVWLESLAALKNYANPYFSSSTEAKLGTKTVVDFSSTAGITANALSHRYDKAGN